MPRVNIPIQQITRAGVLIGSGGSEVTGDSVNFHYLDPRGTSDKVFVHFRNNAATTRNITLVFANLVDGQAVTHRIVTLGNAASKVIGPFPPELFAQPGTPGGSGDAAPGCVYINVDSADVRISAFATS